MKAEAEGGVDLTPLGVDEREYTGQGTHKLYLDADQLRRAAGPVTDEREDDERVHERCAGGPGRHGEG